MLHVRVASSPAQTAEIVGLLSGSPGVVNLVVVPGAARLPAGDAVQFDLSLATANPVLDRLRGLRSGAAGPIAIESVDATIGAGEIDRPKRATRLGRSFYGDTAPVWDMVESKITADAVYAPSFYALLALAGLIGAVGILTNSSILIVGAMVVGPEYSAIAAVALGIERRDRSAIGRGMRALLVGFAVAIAVTLLFSLVIRGIGHVPRAFELGVRPASDFISSPDLFSVIVAILAGVVGVVSMTEARAGSLIGVFISVTTIPAAADIGLALAFQTYQAAGGAALQLLLNVVLLIVVGAATMHGQRLFWRAMTRRMPQERGGR
jgi:uncharacterized hydrophobic protein (TIGR00271 family)